MTLPTWVWYYIASTRSLLNHSLLQHCSILQHNLFGSDKDAQDLARRRRAVEPLMVYALLDNKLPGLDSLLLAAVESQDNFTSKNDTVIDALRTMHWGGTTRLELRDAEDSTLGRAPWDRVGEAGDSIRVVYWHRLADVEDGERAGSGAKRHERREASVRGEDRGAIFRVGSSHKARKRAGLVGLGGLVNHDEDIGLFEVIFVQDGRNVVQTKSCKTRQWCKCCVRKDVRSKLRLMI